MIDYKIVIGTIVIIFVAPFILLLCVKLGTYGFFKGRKLFQDEIEEE